jgi:hypothetical protein
MCSIITFPLLNQTFPTFPYEFQTLSASDLHDPDISALIAAKMKEFHGLEMPGPKDVSLWHRLRLFSFIFFSNSFFVIKEK